MEGHLEKLRRAELNCVKRYFEPGMRVLEIGGGNGYQASLIASWGCEVLSIDIQNRPASSQNFYKVYDYDGKSFPSEDRSFDIVFSSNVLEHINPLTDTMAEIQRVLKPGGLAIHILPSSAWRFWTSITHYVYILKRLIGQEHAIAGVEKQPSFQEKTRERGILYVIGRILIAGSHGEYPNALSELYYFSKHHWCKVFLSNGFELLDMRGNDLFYTGYGLFPGLPLEKRCTMAQFMGDSCNIFVMKATPET